MKLLKHNSDSTFQKRLEQKIVSSFFKRKNIDYILDGFSLIQQINQVKFQFDIFDKEKNIVGEVYVCNKDLKSGHTRKIASDVLKLNTYEKLSKTNLTKVYILAFGLDNFSKEDFYSLKDELPLELKEVNLIGNSWLKEAFNTSGIELFYFILCPKDYQNLKKTRLKQKQDALI